MTHCKQVMDIWVLMLGEELNELYLSVILANFSLTQLGR